MGSLLRSACPAREGEGNAGDVERTEDEFVVLGQPLWKVDIKVRPTIAGVPGSHRCERTTPLVEDEHGDFAGDYGSEPASEAVFTEPGGHRKGNNATGE